MEDGLCCDNFVGTPKHVVVEELDEKDLFFDIGLKSLNTLRGLVEEHDVVFWNGTLGVVENEKYKYGSEMLVNFLIEAIHKNPNKKVIVGGGDTGGFVNKYRNNFTHISTGGGASIEYIINNGLVGLDVYKT